MSQNTEFGKSIKHKLIDLDMTNTRLCELVAAKTGKYFDDSQLSRICRGFGGNKEKKKAICEILGLEER